ILAMRTTFGIEGLFAKMAPDYDFADKLHDFFIEEQEMVNIGEMNGGNSRVLKSIERVDRFLGRTSVLKMMPVGPFLLDPDEKRPITEFLFQNKDLIERTGLVDIEFDPSVSGGGNVRMNGALSNGHTDEKVDMFDSDDLKEHMEEEMKKSSKRTTLSVLGGTFLLGSMFFFTTGTGFALPSFLVGLGCFALVRRSFKDNDRILGPKYVATRHRMEQWDEEDGGGSEEENGDFEEEFDGSEVGEPETDLDMSRGSGWNENDEDETMALPEPDEETGYDEPSWQKPDDSFESASEKTGYGNGDDPEREEIGFENVGYSEGSEKESRRRL
ncbi:MAG: hypothetical protein SV760_02575, partial [Halobacteria archaeon]|nr:hypothetical protein [Halobacteria archaeon]